MAEIRDAAIQNTIVNPRGANICPDMPFKSASGINTTQVVTVEPKMEAKDRLDDLAGSLQRRFHIFPEALPLVGAETAFQNNDGVIHHHTDAENETPHGDNV